MNPILHAAAVAALALLLSTGSVGAHAFELVTPAEAQQAARDEGQPSAPAAAASPPRTRSPPRVSPASIRVLSPLPAAAASSVPAPLRIELAFNPAPGARIVPSTFRVLYGVARLDLTERLRAHATVTESGVLVERVQVPPGQHRLLLQVADDQGNLAEQELLVRVGLTA